MSVKAYQLLKSMGLSDERVVSLLLDAQSETFAVDQVLWPKGASLQPWTLIIEGLVCSGIPDADGGLNPVNIYGSGACVGEASFLSGQACALEYVCLTPVRAVGIPIAEALAAFEQDAQFSRYIARLLAWRDQQHVQMLSFMRIGSPALSVVMGLALFAESMLSSSSHLPHFEFDDSLDLPLKQSLLAALCGVSRGIFSVAVKQLAAAGWLHLNYATVSLCRLRAWGLFTRTYHQNRLNAIKPSMQEILSLMEQASVTEPTRASCFTPL